MLDCSQAPPAAAWHFPPVSPTPLSLLPVLGRSHCRPQQPPTQGAPDPLPAYKALAYGAAARSGRQKGPEVDEVTCRLQQVGVLLGGLLLGPHHSALQQLQGV